MHDAFIDKIILMDGCLIVFNTPGQQDKQFKQHLRSDPPALSASNLAGRPRASVKVDTAASREHGAGSGANSG